MEEIKIPKKGPLKMEEISAPGTEAIVALSMVGWMTLRCGIICLKGRDLIMDWRRLTWILTR
jgi:hypothetical protein